MFGIRTLKRRLQSAVVNQLESHDGSRLLLLKENQDIGIFRANFTRSGLKWGFVPLYKMERTGIKPIFSIVENVIKPITEISNQFKEVAQVFSKGTCSRVIESMHGKLVCGIERIRKQAVVDMQTSYATIHQKFLAGVLSKSQNGYKQRLAEVIRTTAKEALAASVKKHIAMLVMKTREVDKKKGPEHTSSGPHALPTGCKFIFKRNNAAIYVVEQLPQVRTVFYLKEPFKISLPYVIFIVTMRDGNFVWLQVVFRTSRLHNETDELLCPAFPNIYDDDDRRFKICFPGPKLPVEVGPDRIVDEAVNNYWGSGFNNDLGAFYEAAGSQFHQIHGFPGWQANTARDPQLALKINWQPSGTNLNALVNKSFIQVLGLEDDPKQKRPTVDVLTEFTDGLADKFGKEVTEKLHFMVEYSKMSQDDLRPAQEELAKIVNNAANGVAAKIEEVFDRAQDKGDLNDLCGDAEVELERLLRVVTDRPVAEIERKLRQI